MAVWTVPLFLGLLLATDGALGGLQHLHKSCPPDWTEYGNRCFKFFKPQVEWVDAETECLKNSGNLASVHSHKENAFLQDLIKKGTGSLMNTWIGGHDAVAEGTWLWSDGSKMDFHDWCKNEPSNYKNKEHCMTMNYGDLNQWNDIPCNLSRPFICARN
ncbi:galactose-specific lectin nattectin-like [Salminus brasiliensis]|uniref:galactose-specific lectin nattectin-like n=1 Tax=Salminus brasiliensis TaxID=930266 RepID=UPI003B838412